MSMLPVCVDDPLLLLKNVCRPSVLVDGYIVSWKGWCLRQTWHVRRTWLDRVGVTAAC